MPLVHVRDDMNLEPEEFVILSYRRELYRGTIFQGTKSICKYMMEILEKNMQKYSTAI